MHIGDHREEAVSVRLGRPSTCCGLRHRDPAVKFMHRTFNYYTNPQTTLLSVSESGGKSGPLCAGANCKLQVVTPTVSWLK